MASAEMQMDVTTELRRILRKVVKNGGYFEWENRIGVPAGSSYFAGGAAVVTQAIWASRFSHQ
jgi:hypothetical protein